MFKIGSLAVLLGIFGLLGSTNAATDACHAQNPPKDGNSHLYTCEYPWSKLCKDGATDQRFWQACSSSALKCHRCVPTAPGNGIVNCVAPNEIDPQTKICGPKKTTSTVTQTEQEKCEARVPKEDVQWNGESITCEQCSAPGVCCGVKLNTDVPFVGKCIRLWSSASSEDTTVVTDTTAFPRLMWGLTKILTTLILLACFGGILAGGVMIASSGGKETNATKGKELIKNVVIAMALLWTSGIILKLINPNFFW